MDHFDHLKFGRTCVGNLGGLPPDPLDQHDGIGLSHLFGEGQGRSRAERTRVGRVSEQKQGGQDNQRGNRLQQTSELHQEISCRERATFTTHFHRHLNHTKRTQRARGENQRKDFTRGEMMVMMFVPVCSENNSWIRGAFGGDASLNWGMALQKCSDS